jgi:DNA-binding transcriptional LysR family regulator
MEILFATTSLHRSMPVLGFGYFYSYQVMPDVNRNKLVVILEDFQPPSLQVSAVYQHRQIEPSKYRRFSKWLIQHLKASLAQT